MPRSGAAWRPHGRTRVGPSVRYRCPAAKRSGSRCHGADPGSPPHGALSRSARRRWRQEPNRAPTSGPKSGRSCRNACPATDRTNPAAWPASGWIPARRRAARPAGTRVWCRGTATQAGSSRGSRQTRTRCRRPASGSLPRRSQRSGAGLTPEPATSATGLSHDPRCPPRRRSRRQAGRATRSTVSCWPAWRGRACNQQPRPTATR